jgi:hypothetical protein
MRISVRAAGKPALPTLVQDLIADTRAIIFTPELAGYTARQAIRCTA